MSLPLHTCEETAVRAVSLELVKRNNAKSVSSAGNVMVTHIEASEKIISLFLNK